MKFNRRLEQAILNKHKNIKQFVENYDLNYSGIRGYVLGTSEPTLSKVEELAKYLDVTPSWLAYGVEESVTSDEERIENVELVNSIYESLEKWLKANKKKTTPAKKSKIVTVIYKQLMEKENISSTVIETQVSLTMEVVDAA